jgi:hypothetical protein
MKTVHPQFRSCIFGLGFLAALSQSTIAPAEELSNYQIVERGPNHRVIQRVTWTNELGKAVARTNAYTELATGMHYRENGQWKESKAKIKAFPDGAVARQGQHKVIFAYDLAAAGAIDVEAPDGKRLRSNVLGLRLDDGSKSVWLAVLKDSCPGQIIGSNQVVYADAFSGGVAADVRYKYSRYGIEQDILLRTRSLKTPEDYGLSPDSVLQVWTEFLNPPPVTKTQRTIRTGAMQLADEELSWGAMRIRRGRAFSLPGDSTNRVSRSTLATVPVAKQFLNLNGRHFLVEQVAWASIRRELEKLPPAANTSVAPATNSLLNVVSGKRLLPEPRVAKAAVQPMQVAGMLPAKPAYVLDYQEVNGSYTDFTFESGNTYYVSGPVWLAWGTMTFEAGAVIKFAGNPYSSESDLLSCWENPLLGIGAGGTVVCPTDGQAILTLKDDDGVGETIDGSTGNTNYRLEGTYLDSEGGAFLIQNLRFSHAGIAIGTTCTGTQITNCYFGDCITCVAMISAGEIALYDSQFEASGTVVDFATLTCPVIDNPYGLDARDLNGAGNSGASELLRWPSYTPSSGDYAGVRVTLTNCCNVNDQQAQNLGTLGQSLLDGGGTFFWTDCYDSDHNGLNDNWEQQYFGHLGNDPNADPDGDGWTTLQEYWNGTNPAAYNSRNGLASGNELRVFTPLK